MRERGEEERRNEGGEKGREGEEERSKEARE